MLSRMTRRILRRPQNPPNTGRLGPPPNMNCQRLLKARALLRRLAVPLRQQSRLPQHAPYAGLTHRHDVCVEHHERKPAVALQRVLEMESEDGLLLPIPPARNHGEPSCCARSPSVAFSPIVEFAGSHIEPSDEVPGADLGLLRPAPDEIHDLIPRIVRNPDPGQSSPSFFFSLTCSAHQLGQDFVLGLDLLLQVGASLLLTPVTRGWTSFSRVLLRYRGSSAPMPANFVRC